MMLRTGPPPNNHFTALVCRDPGQKIHEDTSHDEPVGASQVDDQGSQHGEHGDGEDVITPTFIDQHTAGNRRDELIDAEGRRNQALQVRDVTWGSLKKINRNLNKNNWIVDFEEENSQIVKGIPLKNLMKIG